MTLDVLGGDVDKHGSPFTILVGPALFSIVIITLVQEFNSNTSQHIYVMILPPIIEPGLLDANHFLQLNCSG